MVHVFKRAGLNLALDVGSSTVHILDEIAYALLASLAPESYAMDELPAEQLGALGIPASAEAADAFAELKKLVGEGLLFASDDYSEFAPQLGPAPVKAMCLHIAHDCNLRCRYCFASTGGFGGARKLMPPDVAKNAIDLLMRLSEGRRNLEVDFFGGEPLMNFDVVRETLRYARSVEEAAGKNFRFTITTNGVGLTNEITETINREMANVVLSLDGRQEVNDTMRPTVGGKGSYELIVPKYQHLVQARGGREYYVRGTYTRHNLDFDRDVLALYGLGFNQISVEPVVGPETDDYSIRAEDLAAIEESYTRLMEELVIRRKTRKGSFNFFHFMLDLENGPCAIKRLKGCGSGNEYLAVTPDGELYPCHQFVGNTKFLMGNVKEGITRQNIKEDFARANLLEKPECQNCWAKLYCSGGCNANNYSFNGDVRKPHKLSCKLERMRLECAIALKAVCTLDL